MATQVIQRSDRFPVGTAVKAYAGRTPAQTGKPAGALVESQTVDALGRLTFTGLTLGREYTLYAEVGGVGQKVTTFVSEPFTASTGLLERVRARRRELGV